MAYRLTLNTASGYALHNVLTKEYEYKEEGERDESNRCHLLRNIGVTRRVGEGVTKTVCNKSVRLVVCNESGPHIGVPRTHHLKNCDRDEVGEGEGNHYSPKVLKVACTVNLRREVKLVGDLLKIFLEQINVEDRRHRG